MSRRLALLTNFAVIAALFIGAGAHLAVLQSVAWTKMLVDYSRTEGIAAAVEKTFDGQHPCTLCMKVQTTEHEQQEQQATSPVPDIKGVIAPALIACMPSFVIVDFPWMDCAGTQSRDLPSVPPPRA